MKKVLAICLAIAAMQSSQNHLLAQKKNFELLAGNNHLYYQHAVGGKLSDNSKWGWLHLAAVVNRYDKNIGKSRLGDELMNQAYLSFSLAKRFSVLAGGKYTNANGIVGSVAIHYVAASKNSVFVLLPRMDLKEDAGYELFSMYEVRPRLNDVLKLYIRLQGTTSHGPYHHNRSYQQLRLGVQYKQTQLGIGLNLDQYGKSAPTYLNSGIFIRKHVI